MSEINYQELREIAKKATQGEWVAFISPGKYGTYAVHTPGDNHHGDIVDWPGFDEQKNAENNARYIAAFNPEVVQALLDERERNQQYIKSRDQENEDIALTVGKLLIENGQLVADTLRHLADNEIDSDYFAITSTNENGTEIDHEMAITDYALQAAGTVDELVAALESAEKRIAELSASHSKLRDTMAGIHNTIRMDGGYTPLAAILNAAKRAYEESASAAGIRIKGE
ncbi:TPA: ead/Ea22-like family protein [Escherichia coli]|nr:ead/Ea22-like family protein [Escherichia coli]EJW0396160.1 ead/Ea22-like family protein [Escherichia coli]EKA4291625.1 ead/Ea22-like family protein [Escherichia coli]ELV1690740.1 ead/Ea22-like family protein [Escherichia coli]HAM9346941.1 ead/Ea22-like family protein [Escherichia coli]